VGDVEVMAAEVAAYLHDAHLSGGELAVLAGLAAGSSYARIARQLGTSVDATRQRAGRAARKLDAQSVVHAVAIAIARGLIPGANA
jgi:DNA-binding CsgD family transcriptional regulator